MQKFKKIYRSNYTGEQVVVNATLNNSEWETEHEHVPNSVSNTYTTTHAVAIGNGESRLGINLNLIGTHQGGLFGTNRLQSYGCNALYRDFAPDFLVAVGPAIIKEIAESGYTDDHIVYTNGTSVLEYPGKFYLLPQNLHFDAGALAAYMACFDGHKKVFLLGYDSYMQPGPVNNVYKDTNGYAPSDNIENKEYITNTLSAIMETYSDVEFVRVMPTAGQWVAEAFSNLPNFRQIGFRDFVLEADLG
jgi:hypothetical protein